MKPKVYLAGPIFQQSDDICKDWRSQFKTCQMFDWLDPMRRDYRGREDAAFAEIVEGDKDDIDGCQAVVAKVNPPSAGTSMEILWAWLNHTPVIAITEGRVSPWVRYHATDICASEDAALQRLKELLA
jgi:nucleoside 2-deoxyribosyltransferase